MFRAKCQYKLLCILALLSSAVLPDMQLLAEIIPSKSKNIILIIGDGMGPQQIGLLEAYARYAPKSAVKNRTTAFTRMLYDGGVMGMSITNAANSLTVDSAASASQIALGTAVLPEVIGLDINGKSQSNLVEVAKNKGLSTGLVSNVRLTHATPAAFAAHQPKRSMENEIAVDMLNAGVDVMLSGGLRHWIPQSANNQNSAAFKELLKLTNGVVEIKSKRKDERNLLTEAKKQGYQLAFNNNQLQRSAGKILGLFAPSAFPFSIDVHQLKNSNGYTIPTLKEMAMKAITVLSDNEKGFFLMIEAGLIDWAAHYNDTGTMLHEMLEINEVLNAVLDWTSGRDDTLVVVTADHETGGFGFSYSSVSLPVAKKFPGSIFSDTVFKPNQNYGDPLILDKLYNQQLSYSEIFLAKFDQLAKAEQTHDALKQLVNQYTEFNISSEQAKKILATKNNTYYVKGHDDLDYKEIPNIVVNEAFFSYPKDDNRQNLLAIEVANKQSVVWSNGNHTATPVMVFAKGRTNEISTFTQLMDHVQLGQKLKHAINDKINIIESK